MDSIGKALVGVRIWDNRSVLHMAEWAKQGLMGTIQAGVGYEIEAS